jgi:hypothetical protein
MAAPVFDLYLSFIRADINNLISRDSVHQAFHETMYKSTYDVVSGVAGLTRIWIRRVEQYHSFITEDHGTTTRYCLESNLLATYLEDGAKISAEIEAITPEDRTIPTSGMDLMQRLDAYSQRFNPLLLGQC